MEAPHSKTILAMTAIALFALAFTPALATAKSYPTPTAMSLNMSGQEFNPSNGQIGTFTLSLGSSIPSPFPGFTAFYYTQGALVFGSACGTITDTVLGSNVMCGGWKYDTSSNKTMMKMVGVGFSINIAFITQGTANSNAYQAVINVDGVPGLQNLRLASTSPQLVWSY